MFSEALFLWTFIALSSSFLLINIFLLTLIKYFFIFFLSFLLIEKELKYKILSKQRTHNCCWVARNRLRNTRTFLEVHDKPSTFFSRKCLRNKVLINIIFEDSFFLFLLREYIMRIYLWEYIMRLYLWEPDNPKILSYYYEKMFVLLLWDKTKLWDVIRRNNNKTISK